MINKISTKNKNFFNVLNYFIKKKLKLIKLEKKIKNIIFNVKKFKDKAVIYYSNKFNKNKFKSIKDVFISNNTLKKAYLNINKDLKYTLEICKNKIENFHNEQLKYNFINIKNKEYDKNKNINIKNIINNIGIYIPGGKANYPSSVFMNCLSSNLLNIKNTYVVSPFKNYNSIVLACLYMLNIKNVLNLGGVQAIAGLTYGFKGIDKCNKIYGPGNIYLAIAKKLLYGEIGIDMIAGPSEVLIYSKNYNNLKPIVFDFFSQSEHDELAQSILISDNKNYLNIIDSEIKNYIPFNYKKLIIKESIKNKNLLIKSFNKKESINLINYISPEHLIINKKNNHIIKYINNFGSMFLNNYSSESFGDYISGINHVLPTNQNSKFASNLNINDYLKSSSVIKSNKINYCKLFKTASFIAISEELQCHAENLFLRRNEKNIWNF